MPGYKFKNEEELIAIAKNNPKIFRELYDAYYPRIFGYIFRITGDHALACDITAEIFLKAWLKIGSFRWKGVSISSWFFKIATNELNQYFRKRKYSPRVLLDVSFVDEAKIKSADYPNRNRRPGEPENISGDSKAVVQDRPSVDWLPVFVRLTIHFPGLTSL